MKELFILSVVNLTGDFVEIENHAFTDKVSAFIGLQNEYNYTRSLPGFNDGESWCETYDNNGDFYAEFGENKYITGTINIVSVN